MHSRGAVPPSLSQRSITTALPAHSSGCCAHNRAVGLGYWERKPRHMLKSAATGGSCARWVVEDCWVALLRLSTTAIESCRSTTSPSNRHSETWPLHCAGRCSACKAAWPTWLGRSAWSAKAWRSVKTWRKSRKTVLVREPAPESATAQSHAPAPAAAIAPKKYATLMFFFFLMKDLNDQMLRKLLLIVYYSKYTKPYSPLCT